MHSGHWAMVIEGGRIVAGGSGNGQGPRGQIGRWQVLGGSRLSGRVGWAVVVSPGSREYRLADAAAAASFKLALRLESWDLQPTRDPRTFPEPSAFIRTDPLRRETNCAKLYQSKLSLRHPITGYGLPPLRGR